MDAHPLAGQPAPPEVLVDVDALLGAYFDDSPDPSDPSQRVSFGTSGHRGSSFRRSFNEAHILATTQAICDYRQAEGITIGGSILVRSILNLQIAHDLHQRSIISPVAAFRGTKETSERSTNDNPDAYDQWQRWANKNQRQQRRKFFRRKSQKHNLLDDDVDDAVERFMKMSSNSCRSAEQR